MEKLYNRASEKLYTCEEVAERYSVQTRTVWDWVRTGKLSAVRYGRIYRIREEDIAAFDAANASPTVHVL